MKSEPTSKYLTCFVCVCAYKYTCNHIHSHARRKTQKIQTKPLSFLMPKNYVPHQNIA